MWLWAAPGWTTFFHISQVLVISLTFLQYIQDHWLRKRHRFPSLGFVGLLYALHTCDQVRHLLQLRFSSPCQQCPFSQGLQIESKVFCLAYKILLDTTPFLFSL